MVDTTEAKAGPDIHLTPTERRILEFVAAHEGRPCSKAMIAQKLGSNQKTVDRLISHLRREGCLVVETTWNDAGGQGANTYRLP